ncbi:MAG TPA: hypothetical protein VGJ00_02515 [Rhabdochlamydiaceae bacterium]|jgi:hypothetical protein
MGTLPMSISSSSSSLSTEMHIHRRSSAPTTTHKITTTDITPSSGGTSSQLTRKKVKNLAPNHYLHSMPTGTLPNVESHFLQLPPHSKSRNRSSSVPIINPVILHGDMSSSALTSSSSSSSSSSPKTFVSVHLTYFQPKENKEQEGRKKLSKSRDTTVLSYADMQKAEQHLKTKKPKDYLQIAIRLYEGVVFTQNRSNPWVEPYLRLADVMSDHIGAVKNLSEPTRIIEKSDIIPLLDSVIKGPFDEWERTDALLRKATLLTTKQDQNIPQALECWVEARTLVESLTSASDKISRKKYLKDINKSISKHTTTA